MINLSQETESLAQRLAVAKQLSVEEAVRLALEEKARAEGIAPEPRQRRDTSPEAIDARRKRIDEIVRQVATLPVLDPRPTQEIIDALNEL